MFMIRYYRYIKHLKNSADVEYDATERMWKKMFVCWRCGDYYSKQSRWGSGCGDCAYDAMERDCRQRD